MTVGDLMDRLAQMPRETILLRDDKGFRVQREYRTIPHVVAVRMHVSGLWWKRDAEILNYSHFGPLVGALIL